MIKDDFYEEKFYVVKNTSLLEALEGYDKQNQYAIKKFLQTASEINGDKEYLVVNHDEPYAQDVYDLIKQNTKQIVCFVGRAGSGKDYQCSLLQEKGFTKLAFADALRDIAFSALCIDKEWGMANYEEIKADDEFISVKGIYTPSNLSFRKFLELLGTQGIRKYDEGFWVKALCNIIFKQDLKRVCISDMRFVNEYLKTREFAQQQGYEFKCVFCDYHSERYQEQNNHESARLANRLCGLGYQDLQEIKLEDIEKLVREGLI